MQFSDYPIYGDGIHDDAGGLQALLDSGERELYIPQGCYRIGRTLKIRSGTRLTASENARFILDGSVPKRRGDFLISNADTENGNENITITGGVWDGNNQGPGNQKPDIFDQNGYSGTVMNFFRVKGLVLKNFVVANSVTYNLRMAAVEHFQIENISFVSDCPGQSQDGLHFGGGVRNGTVKNIRALSKGQTNDDFIALNADDSLERVENFGLCRDAIENITFENLFAEDCHTMIRLLSVTAPIRNIQFRNIYCGYRCYAVNGDAARYCRTPLFREEDMPQGAGQIEDVTIENMTVYSTSSARPTPAVCMESRAHRFTVRNFRLIQRGDEPKPQWALQVRNVAGQSCTADGKNYRLETKDEKLELPDFTQAQFFLD